MALRKAKMADDEKDTADSTDEKDPKESKGSNRAKDSKDTKGSKGSKDTKGSKDKKAVVGGAVAQVRTRVAQVVWLFFVLCALLLAVGALLVALDANNKNSLVGFVLDGAAAVDLGIFSRSNGIKEFEGSGADVKNALLNWGLGAVAYLIVGRILDRIIRP